MKPTKKRAIEELLAAAMALTEDKLSRGFCVHDHQSNLLTIRQSIFDLVRLGHLRPTNSQGYYIKREIDRIDRVSTDRTKVIGVEVMDGPDV